MKRTLGEVIAQSRRAKGMTQLELAQKMNVTDKAVSKWERDLSCPDINSLPLLAQTLEIPVTELLQGGEPCAPRKKPTAELVDTVLRSVSLAMGIAVAVLTTMHALDAQEGLKLLGIGLSCLAITHFKQI